ncbi:MAG: dihydroneopterin aldolase [Candidatus Eremiobacteraeota bacterium]|nr:dihydroneopterin aldolase [Candidatus Eremiobacteraeota bacterium]MBC5802007.1 dihydroneopterin aldolase [Candidatus Eremiobacteraeota bacterium]MBC5820397.1 dihydroneopterin aldolase [Candidatus Eremiobacteraeota bacterium]
MAETIELRNVRAYGRHGADPGERERVQPLDVRLRLDVDVQRARHSDALTDTLNYAALHARVLEIVATHSYALLERLGEVLLSDVMRDQRVSAAEVTIAKPRRLGGATPAVTLRSKR